MLLPCCQGEAGFSETSVGEVAAVLDLTETVSERADETVGTGGDGSAV
jgi:hypothetical protein